MPNTALQIVHVDPRTLVPADYNPRQIDAAARERLAHGIGHYGFVEPIVVRFADNLIIGGHQRLDIAIEMGLDTVPVVYLDDLPDEDAKALNILLNNPEAQGRFDLTALSSIFDDLQSSGFDITLTGYDTEYVASLLAQVEEGFDTAALLAPHEELPDEPEDVDLTPPEVARSVPGTLYLLGRHRLYCGDATNPEHVAALLGSGAPRLMVTDPPYGVEYDGTWRNDVLEQAWGPSTRIDPVENDDRADWRQAWWLSPADVAYVWHAGVRAAEVQESLEAAPEDRPRWRYIMRSQIVWIKSRFVISRGAYHWQHEPCWYAVREGRTAEWIGDRSQSTVWQINRERATEVVEAHSTQKPIECMRRPIRHHNGDVYDPFGGTGTTLIAAHQLGRACYMMELNPAYCDVIRRRYAEFANDPSALP